MRKLTCKITHQALHLIGHWIFGLDIPQPTFNSLNLIRPNFKQYITLQPPKQKCSRKCRLTRRHVKLGTFHRELTSLELESSGALAILRRIFYETIHLLLTMAKISSMTSGRLISMGLAWTSSRHLSCIPNTNTLSQEVAESPKWNISCEHHQNALSFEKGLWNNPAKSFIKCIYVCICTYSVTTLMIILVRTCSYLSEPL